MARLRMFFRCIGEAVCAKGLKAVMTLVPFGDAIYEIADETYKRIKLAMRAEEQLAVIGAAAAATLEETKREAEEAVKEIVEHQAQAGEPPIPLEAQINLVRYLTQVPSAVRQTMKRPSDPGGKTVPASFTLQKADQLLTMLPARLPSFKPGDRPAGIGNWELVEQLGAGGFGEVWLARHPTLHGLTAALKFCLDEQAASTLRHEANLLDRVMQQSGRHPGIVTLRQAYLESSPLCLEYEYVNGGDLAALLGEWHRGGKVPRAQVNVLIQRLADIVGAAHKLSPPIVHRDLKPANILIERSTEGKIRLRITDFGIGGVAASQAIQSTKRGTTGRHETLATSLRGAHTPLYASPQQVRGEAPDPRDDVHALGVIWYQMLTGDLTSGVPADWSTELEERGQPPELIKLLGACVASKPEKRLATAAVLAEQLQAALDAEKVLDVIPVAEPADAEPVEDEPVPPAPKPVTVRPVVRQPETVRPVRPLTQRGVPQELNDPVPVAALATPPPPPATIPAPAPAPQQPRPGNQMRRYSAPGVTIPELMRELETWLRGEGFNYQDLRTEDGRTLIQIEKQGGWRKFVGMSSALNVILHKQGDELTVEVGAGQWFDKAAAGAVSLFILWPLAVTAAIGVWNQMKLPERVFSRIGDLIAAKRSQPQAVAATTGGLSPDRITQLRELATLRDQGILTEEEFQAEKARLLGR